MRAKIYAEKNIEVHNCGMIYYEKADFLCSKTGKALYDEKTRIWCNGSSYIAELYMEELKKAGYEE